MKLLLLSDAASIHTRRWVSALSVRGCDILLFSLLRSDGSAYADIPHVQVYSCDFYIDERSRRSQRLFDKLVYIRALSRLHKVIRHFRPDVIHAHYASSYGLLAALSGYHPFLLSVWGSDVYRYPRSSRLGEWLLRFTLRRADRIFSTSRCMARQTNLYTSKPVSVTPFGVDMQRFTPLQPSTKPARFVVGNVKSLAEIYGIDTLIQAFALLCHRNVSLDPRLVIVGEGPDRAALEQLCKELQIDSHVDFLGYIPNEQLPSLYGMFDVAVSLSREESFGVVAVEAMACQCPVVTSDAEGFREVVIDGETGFIVPKDDPEQAAQAIQRFIDDPSLRRSMGESGRRHVARHYDWQRNVDTMVQHYAAFASCPMDSE